MEDEVEGGSEKQADEQCYDKKKDPVKRNQLGESEESVCMIPNNPESERRTKQKRRSMCECER